MRRAFLAVSPVVGAVLILFLARGCGGGGGADTGTPLPPPPNLDLPADIASSIPRTEAGVPILMSISDGLPAGVGLALTYDSNNNDPISLWGSCLGRVGACYRVNQGHLGGCVERIVTCVGGGRGCCPPECIAAYKKALVSNGGDEDKAVDDSFMNGACVPGFTAVNP